MGWSAATTKDVAFVESCLSMALWRRDHLGRPFLAGMIHHCDAGSQYTSIRFTETLALQGLSASIGSVGDAYDNAVAESFMGLFKNEAVAAGSPFRTGPLRTLADVEALTMTYVDWSRYAGDPLPVRWGRGGRVAGSIGGPWWGSSRACSALLDPVAVS